MLTEIVTRYLAFCATGGLPASAETRVTGEAARGTSDPPVRFADFVALERSVIDSPVEREFWACRLEGVSATRLPRWERRDTVEPRHRFGLHAVSLRGELSGQLHEIARQLKVPIKSVLLAAHLKVLSTWSGRRDVLTGLIANGRPETADSERVLGLFLNTIPLSLSLAPASWADLVRQVHASELEVLPHRRYPLADIQRILGTQDLIETSFNFIHFHVYQGLSGVGPIEVLDATAYERTNFTLMATFSIDPLSDRSDVGLMLHYDACELNEDQVRALADSYVNVLRATTLNPNGRHDSLTFLPEAHRRRVLEGLNETAVARPAPICLHEFFAAQAARMPDEIAVVCGDESLTYGDLRAKSSHLARYLQRLGVGPEIMVGVCMERSADLIVAMLAVLQAGGAYVPLDPAYPAERLKFILEDANAPVVVASKDLTDHLQGYNGRVVFLDVIAHESDVISRPSPQAPSPRPSPSNLAYIIYTSGSTGRPKGVAIEHRSACELMRWARDTYGDAELSGVLASTSICFDLSVFEIFVPLSWGGRVIVVPNALALPDLPADANVTLVNTVPSAMAELVRLGGLPATVRTVNLAGEPLTPQLVDQVYASGNVDRVYDLYGPSEDTTYSTFAQRVAGGRATIGRPISNSRAYILDEDLHPVPLGATGELYIAGAGLARGYLKRGDLTAERFCPDPFSSEPGGRMYHTGDLARYLPDGYIDFLGRADYQVKIRGFRIELGEIEAVMNGYAGVRDAVVSVVGQDGDKRLVAYYVRQTDSGLTESGLRGHLSRRLPSHMVPAGLVELAAMPMTPNGKIDRKALPAWNPAGTDRGCVLAPRDEIEEQIAHCWRELLNLDQIGVDDNFFELGGHSLLATQAVSRMREIFAMPLALRSIFDAPTVAGLAEAVKHARSIQQAAANGPGDDTEREEIEL
jgi:microcystin synthetase protein McyA